MFDSGNSESHLEMGDTEGHVRGGEFTKMAVFSLPGAGGPVIRTGAPETGWGWGQGVALLENSTSYITWDY